MVEPRQVPSSEVHRHFAEHIERVIAGETFTVSRHGRPVAEIRPVAENEETTNDDRDD